MGTSALSSPQRGQKFQARLTAISNGPLLHVDYEGDGRAVARQDRNIAHRPFNGYWLYRENATAAQFHHAGRAFITTSGTLLVADADVPFDAVPKGRYRHQAWLVPKRLLDPHLPARGGPLSVPLSGRSGVTAPMPTSCRMRRAPTR